MEIFSVFWRTFLLRLIPEEKRALRPMVTVIHSDYKTGTVAIAFFKVIAPTCVIA
jgi:hypothetical protein